MKNSLEYLSKTSGKRKIAVLGDMFELGDYAEELHREVGREVEKNNIDILITAGNFSKYIDEEVKNVRDKIHLKDKKEVIEKLKELQQEGDVILLKASNGMKFYEIVEEL